MAVTELLQNKIKLKRWPVLKRWKRRKGMMGRLRAVEVKGWR